MFQLRARQSHQRHCELVENYPPLSGGWTRSEKDDFEQG